MARPFKLIEPTLMLRNGTYYAKWYDVEKRRVERQSLQTDDLALAQSGLAAFKDAFAAGTYKRQHRGDSKKGPELPWVHWAQKMCKRARENAKAKGRTFDLDPDFVLRLLANQGHRCAVTCIPLSNRGFYRNPFAPSLDQIRPGQGYTPENVRIVAVIVNTAMNGWGEEPLYRLIYESRISRKDTRQLTRQIGACYMGATDLSD